MAQPPPYVRRYDFVSYQTLNPSKPLPGQQHENEYNAIALSINQTITNLGLIQRDDGALANGSVGWDQLDGEVIIGISQPTDWAPNTQYASGDMVYAEGRIYRCDQSHISSQVFADDLAAGRWVVQVDFVQATTDAEEAAARAEAALDEFTDIYLGAFNNPPLTDLDGAPLREGAIYFDMPADEMRVWNGATWQFVGSSGSNGVASFNTRTGVVTLLAQDVTDTGVLTGYTTKTYVDAADAALASSIGGKADKTYVDTQDAALSSAISAKANLDSPTFTGDPKAPTPALGDNDTSIATTQWVKQQGYTSSVPDVNKAYVDQQDSALNTAKYDKTGGPINGPSSAKRTSAGTVTGTYSPNFALSDDHEATVGSAVTLGVPAGLVAGQSGIIYITMATGAVLSFASAWDWEGGTVPTPSTANGAVDAVAYHVRSPASIVAKYLKAVA